MTYLKINNIDFSKYVNKLKVAVKHNYKSMTSAAGNTLVKYINSKRVIEIGIIPLDEVAMQELLAEVKKFQVTLSYLNPETNQLEENVNCIIPNISRKIKGIITCTTSSRPSFPRTLSVRTQRTVII